MATPISSQQLDIADSDVAHDFSPLLVIYNDGRVHRLMGTETVPLSDSDSVRSKDVQISSSTSARLYLPNQNSNRKSKLPLLIYFHGGAFVIESAKSPTYHTYLTRLASEASIVIVSVDYRLAPEHPLPAAFDDSLEAVLWAVSLSDDWLSDSADLSRVFLAGDSAGATIAHNLALLDLEGKIHLSGLILVHPFFMGKGDEEWEFGIRFWGLLCSDGRGVDHPWINPVAEGRMAALGAGKVLVVVAEKDFLRDRGVWYAEEMKKSGYSGKVQLVETMEEGHVFHLFDPANPNSHKMMTDLVHFINT